MRIETGVAELCCESLYQKRFINRFSLLPQDSQYMFIPVYYQFTRQIPHLTNQEPLVIILKGALACITFEKGGTLSVIHTLPPISEPLPIVTRPSTVAPA